MVSLLDLNFSKSHDLQNVNHNMLRAHWCGNFNQSLSKASPWERAGTWYFPPQFERDKKLMKSDDNGLYDVLKQIKPSEFKVRLWWLWWFISPICTYFMNIVDCIYDFHLPMNYLGFRAVKVKKSSISHFKS